MSEREDRLEALLTEFVVDVFDDDCRLDHHGNCQAHFLQPEAECIVRRARQELELGTSAGADLAPRLKP
jgi:hypothetical protein